MAILIKDRLFLNSWLITAVIILENWIVVLVTFLLDLLGALLTTRHNNCLGGTERLLFLWFSFQEVKEIHDTIFKAWFTSWLISFRSVDRRSWMVHHLVICVFSCGLTVVLLAELRQLLLSIGNFFSLIHDMLRWKQVVEPTSAWCYWLWALNARS